MSANSTDSILGAKELDAWLEIVSQLSYDNVTQGVGGPFAAVVVKDGEIIGKGTNRVLADQDPTAHAEVVAIRDACKKLGSFQIEDCILITSCEPCPMCLGAIFWARPKVVYYCNSREDAASIGFDDNLIYEQIGLTPASRIIPCVAVPYPKAGKAFSLWKEKTDKTQY